MDLPAPAPATAPAPPPGPAALSTDGTSPLRLKEMTPSAVAAALEHDRRLIVPVGTVEALDPSLPMGAATIIVERLADDLSAEFGVLRAPTVEYGVNPATRGAAAGAVTLRKKTLHRFLNDMLTTWESHGVTEFILLTAHGFDPHQEAMATVVTARARVRVVDLFAVNLSDLVGVRRSEDDRGEVFRSVLLYLAPSVVQSSTAHADAAASRGQALYQRIRARISERIFLAPVPGE